MRVSYDWLKEYIDPGYSPRELAEKLTLAGIEVDTAEPFMTELPRVVVGSITGIKPHPRSEKLTLVEVDSGDKRLSVVCGARNIAVGQKVPLALPGAELPGKGRLEASEVHGVLSEGMLCSPGELGLDLGEAAEAGILILDRAALPGDRVDRTLGLDDPIIILEITPNRADCLGMLGVAYEVAALKGGQVRLPLTKPPEDEVEIGEAARVAVLDYGLCPRYTARVIRGVTIGEAPLWMKLRLLKAGIRPINNIVDITNYVMMEYGQPLHGFDYDLLRGGEIIVRPGRDGEKLVTLDGVERELDEAVLLITDQQGPVGLAGVMGGENSEIGPGTRNVLLEAARFEPASIRRTARRYNLPSEASQRFERGINPDWVPAAQNRAALLIAQLADGQVMRGMIDINPEPVRPRRITARPHRVNEILGLKIPVEEVSAILERLGFVVERGSSRTLEVTVPPRRGDIFLEEDLVEEVARLYGYDNIPVTLPRGELVASRDSLDQQLQTVVKDTLISAGFFEVITYAFINADHLESLRLTEGDPRLKAIPLQNPLSEDQGVMRTTLVPGLLKTLQHNFNYREMNQLLFEIGAVYTPRNLPLDELPHEGARLAVAATGSVPQASWIASSQEAGFFMVKGALEALLSRLGISQVEFVPAKLPFTHPTRTASIRIAGEEAGFLGQLHPTVAETWDIKQPVTICELDLDILSGRADLVPRVTQLSRYPASSRDLAIVVSREIPACELERCIWEAGGSLVDEINLFDLYEGEQIPEGKKSLAFAITYRRPEGTLTDAEVGDAQERIERALSALGAVLRR